tara:strand:+ start:7465 stop:8736 length:1272 start_codon:yes stop_codon:yes gene_type:complete
MLVVFVLGYVAIALEHPIKVDKAASALIIGALGWALFAFSGMEAHHISEELKHHLVDIAEILFFLLGAMTIVELIDVHEGFTVITDKIATRHRVKLMWILCIITFFFSAVLDNLTTSIVMAALISKLIKDKNDLWMFAGMIIISANAGGAWSPIGDVTTIMLWIGGQVTAASIIKAIIIPSIVCLIVPLTYISFKMKGELAPLSIEENKGNTFKVPSSERNLVFILGVAGLLFVPVFKTVTHLPPYLGILFSLGVLWLVTELLHAKKSSEIKSKLSVIAVIKKVDVATIFFFMGILLAVASLQSMGHLKDLALILNDTFNGNIYAINIIIGLLSSIVDNVPLVAGAMGMYEVSEVGLFAVDGKFWQFLAYCAGTGGSVLIIGSAAGVAVMGILKVDFIWYVKKISILALMGYLAGAATYILMQ